MPENPFEQDLLLNGNFCDDYKKHLEDLEEKSKYLCTELKERLVILTTSLKSLKEDVLEEKELWKGEIKKTIELEKTLSEHHCGDFNNRQFELLTNAVLKKSQTEIQNQISSAVYKQQLLEAENMCNTEMIKIRKSLERLAPLQAMVNDWNSEVEESEICESDKVIDKREID